MGNPCDVKVAGEPLDIERVTSGSERGRWKSVHQDNSLAAYSTARSVLRGLGEREPTWLPGGFIWKAEGRHAAASRRRPCGETPWKPYMQLYGVKYS